ncbi:hypothetical protein D3C87_1010800 [compost metagenome]
MRQMNCLKYCHLPRKWKNRHAIRQTRPESPRRARRPPDHPQRDARRGARLPQPACDQLVLAASARVLQGRIAAAHRQVIRPHAAGCRTGQTGSRRAPACAGHLPGTANIRPGHLAAALRHRFLGLRHLGVAVGGGQARGQRSAADGVRPARQKPTVSRPVAGRRDRAAHHAAVRHRARASFRVVVRGHVFMSREPRAFRHDEEAHGGAVFRGLAHRCRVGRWSAPDL